MIGNHPFLFCNCFAGEALLALIFKPPTCCVMFTIVTFSRIVSSSVGACLKIEVQGSKAMQVWKSDVVVFIVLLGWL